MVLADLIERIRGEYLDVPDLRLHPQPAQGLWHFERRGWDDLLGRLTDGRLVPSDGTAAGGDDSSSAGTLRGQPEERAESTRRR